MVGRWQQVQAAAAEPSKAAGAARRLRRQRQAPPCRPALLHSPMSSCSCSETPKGASRKQAKRSNTRASVIRGQQQARRVAAAIQRSHGLEAICSSHRALAGTAMAASARLCAPRRRLKCANSPQMQHRLVCRPQARVGHERRRTLAAISTPHWRIMATLLPRPLHAVQSGSWLQQWLCSSQTPWHSSKSSSMPSLGNELRSSRTRCQLAAAVRNGWRQKHIIAHDVVHLH